MLRKVRALLDKADSTPFEAEADAFRAKADELMLKYAIESYELEQSRPATERRAEPVLRRFFICRADNPVKDEIITLFSAVADHTRCKGVLHGARLGSGEVEGTVVGFPADTEYCEMLFTSLWLQMSRGLEPQPNQDLSYDDNVVMLLQSGLDRGTVARLMGHEPGPEKKRAMAKMSKIWKEWCDRNGEFQTRPNNLTYARNFANGYVGAVWDRLIELKKRQGEELKGSGKDLVLYDLSNAVNIKFVEAFPYLGSTYKGRAEGKFLGAAYTRGSKAGREADLGQTRMRAGSRSALPDGR
jgi:hypothetical protein